MSVKTTKRICLIILIISLVLTTIFISCAENGTATQTHNFHVLRAISPKDYTRPVLAKNFVMVFRENKIYANDKNTGKDKWNYELKNNIIGTPVTDGTYIYAVTPYELVSIDVETGHEVWKKESTDEFISEVFYYKDNLYILGPERLYSIASKLEKPKPGDSESVGQVHINQILYDYNMINDKIGAVIDFKTDTAFMVLFENKTSKFSRIVAVKLTGYNMKEKWSYSSDRDINSILSIDDEGKIYFTSTDGSVHALNTGDGKIIFSSDKN